jgi:hypothetical protein
MSEYFMRRLYRGLEQYFKGNVVIGVEFDQTDNTDGVIRFKVDPSVDLPLPWTKISFFCRAAPGGKVTIHGNYPREKGISHLSWPKLNSCTFSRETSVSDKTIANRVMREIVDPGREPMAEYLAKVAEQKAQEDALPGMIDKYRAMGFTVRTSGNPNATEATFYFAPDHTKVSVSGTIHSNGRVNIDRAYLDAEKGEALMKFLKEIAQ